MAQNPASVYDRNAVTLSIAVGTPQAHLRIFVRTTVVDSERVAQQAAGGTLSECMAIRRHLFRRSFRPTAIER